MLQKHAGNIRKLRQPLVMRPRWQDPISIHCNKVVFVQDVGVIPSFAAFNCCHGEDLLGIWYLGLRLAGHGVERDLVELFNQRAGRS